MFIKTFLLVIKTLLGLLVSGTVAHPRQCLPSGASLALQMLESNIARNQGNADNTTLLGDIELGIFQQSLRESIAYTSERRQTQQWRRYLRSSISSLNESLSTANADVAMPLDRLSVGTSMILEDRTSHTNTFGFDIIALEESVRSQPRNANGGLWYFDNVKNLSAYHNLSYLDGMYSYPSFAILADNRPAHNHGNFGLSAASRQLSILYGVCKTSDGLLVHGYDASKAHAWANPKTGASPVVWARSLSWYTLGLLNALSLSQHLRSTSEYRALQQIFVDLVRAQVMAAERSQKITGSHGVWQVVDRPAAVFSGNKNFIEASASCLTVYSLLRGIRSGLVTDQNLRRRATAVAAGIYQTVLQKFLIRNDNGTLSLNGTSDIASLSGDVSDEYYVTRPIVLNNLIGTSAFTLAGIEVEKLCLSQE